MSDEPPNEQREPRGSQPRNPMFKPGETMPLAEILDRIPLADENLLRDVDAALAGRDLPR
jgi:hypothetical protein